jgi:hypothetical protein
VSIFSDRTSGQATSNRPAAPIPPPIHIVTTTYFAPRQFSKVRMFCP